MPPRAAKRIAQHGRYWLSRRAGSPYWSVSYYDKETQKTIYESTGVTSQDEAERILIVRCLKDADNDNESAKAVALHSVLDLYWDEHGQKLSSKETAEVSIAYWKEHFDGDFLAEKINNRKIEQFVEALREKKFSEGYISRILSVGSAAIKRAHRNGILKISPYIKNNETKRDKRQKPPKGRPLNIDEFATLFVKAKSLRLKIFMLSMAGTLSRPDAIFDLRKTQIDMAWNVVDLNPEGRKQTAKFRPQVPLVDAFKNIVEVSDDYIVHKNGQALNTVRSGWRTMVANSGLPRPDRIKPYSIRHTMARELGARGVSNEDIGLFLGHLPEGSAEITKIYNPYKPGYLTTAVAAVNAYLEELKAEIIKQGGKWDYRESIVKEAKKREKRVK